MHKYLRAIGFSKLKNRRQVNELISVAVRNADERLYTSLDQDTMLAEYNLFCGENMGICVRGEYDESNQFLMDYYIPFFKGSQISSYADISIERHAEKESYAGICDDIKVGVSLIFYLQNIIGYLKRKHAGQLPIMGTSLTLAALSTQGTIIMPILKNEQDVRRTRKISNNRNRLIAQARKGDEDAIENLTLDDMDTYTNIAKMIVKEDVLSLVDTYFMPYGVECDQYAILGEIMDVSKVKNPMTKEEIWQMTVNCNDLFMDVCINCQDLYGEPAVGRRFKGSIWLQGTIHFPE
ncbi:MAG: DUF3881 family protein [Lachnospiraceae bacterium]|nr:DUF3881 family protein [Lachnospiraceae bacterium]